MSLIFGSNKPEKLHLASSICVGLVILLFGAILAACSIASILLGIYRLHPDHGGSSAISFATAVMLAGGAIFGVFLGVRTIATRTTQETDNPDDFEVTWRAEAALAGGRIGAIVGLAVGICFAATGDVQAGISSFGICVLIGGLAFYKYSDFWYL